MSERAATIDAFLAASGWADAVRFPLPGDASFRRYVRLQRGAATAMLMDAPPPQEDVRSYLAIARCLRELDLSAPQLLAAQEEPGLLLIEDFGDGTFTRLLAAGEDEAALYRLAIDVLIALHRRYMPAKAGTAPPPYDEKRLLDEAALLVDWYLPAVTGRPTEAALREEYLAMWRDLLPLARRVPDTLVLRDYHVDNLMRIPGRNGLAACGLLDFQDAVIGPVTYDIVSLLEDSRRDVPAPLVAQMRARYLAAFPALDPAGFELSYAILGAQRHCKVIGIFTRLCRRDGKPRYLAHIPRLWRLIEGNLRHPALTPLQAWLARNIPAELRLVPAAAAA